MTDWEKKEETHQKALEEAEEIMDAVRHLFRDVPGMVNNARVENIVVNGAAAVNLWIRIDRWKRKWTEE